MISATELRFAVLLIGLMAPIAASAATSSGEMYLLTQVSPGSAVTVGENNTCKSIQTLQGIRSSIECAYRCSSSGCSAVAFKDGVCRMVQEFRMFILGQSRCSAANDFIANSGEMIIVSKNIKSPVNKTYNTYGNSSTGRTGTIQSLTVNQTGCYRMEAFGARGGSTNPAYSPVYTGGLGAFIGGSFNLTAGTQISLVIGQRGGDATQSYNHAASGGGGGTFVYRSSDNLLYLAAGGGGGASIGYNGVNGSAGVNGTDTIGTASYIGYGGANGQPGSYGPSTKNYKGGLGAGWLGVASTRSSTCRGERGGGLSQGWVGGITGHGNEGAVGVSAAVEAVAIKAALPEAVAALAAAALAAGIRRLAAAVAPSAQVSTAAPCLAETCSVTTASCCSG